MHFFLFIIPAAVILFEYTAVSAAFAYARFAVEVPLQTVSLLGGVLEVGGNLPYDAVPNAVVALHLTALVMSVFYFVYFVVYGTDSGDDSQTLAREEDNIQLPPPQEG
ncbi:MAG: hypothetical protein CVU89_12885 [Firmicutes bacterium HGW-Firmicutes-14]|nr:MAG: hypothetical protein CVU89_12885 [Firmicutes bacterium HGW-Firmicutes-14]